VGKTLDGRILSWNAAAEQVFGYTAEEIVGLNVRTLIPADRQAEEDRIIASIIRGERVPTFETVRLRKGGQEFDAAITVSPVLDESGRVIAASKIARDITEQKQMMVRLQESERRFRLLADNMSQLAWIADPSGAVSWYNKRWLDYTGMPPADVMGWGWREVLHPDYVEQVTERYGAHVQAGEDWEDTFPLRGAGGEWRWFLSRAVPIRDEDGEISCWFGTNTDITRMREAEERIELLLQEVNHRSKNMLAIIQSLARRGDTSHPDFVERLERRIIGLAANQDVLVRRSWSKIPVMEMIEAQLRSLGESASQVICEGPDVSLSPGAAEALAMAFHEMGTNALKYGALSVPDGHVAVTWSVEGDGKQDVFSISWTESGGPPVSPPRRKGFGTRITIDVPRVKLNAKIETEYARSGFRWRLECARAAIS
jgi:PAS domain S-box-containing protein